LSRIAWFSLLAAAFASCAAPQAERREYVRDGVQYGVTEGRFRGRWWNYYERGRSFLDGGFLPEAEKDLRAALRSRAEDQLWARTYGLHFMPEYFPHRELGIALYRQGQLSDAISELETSISQRFSARAAYHLDRARADWIRDTNADNALPTIEIVAPESSSPVAAIMTQLVGIGRDDTFVAGITIEGRPYPLRVSAPEIQFSREITLLPGENRIEVSVEDLAGRSAKAVVKIRSDVDGPTISFDRPLVLPGTITGVAADPANVVSLEIASAQASLLRRADGLVEFSVDVTHEDLKRPLEYRCEDGYGNVTRGHLPVDTLNARKRGANMLFASATDASVALLLSSRFAAATTAVAEARSDGEPRVRFPNLRDGQRYLMDEILVALDVAATDPLANVQLNGIDLDLIPDRKIQHLSRRTPLTVGENQILALAGDVQGRLGKADVSIQRDLTTVEGLESRLVAAILGNVWKGNAPLMAGEVEVILDELARELTFYKRFSFVDRSLLPEILAEQELSAALGSRDERLALGKLVPAEVMFIGRVRRDAATIEIVLEAISTETGLFVARADVAGQADDLDELRMLVHDLALRVVQEFPRVQGHVALVRSPNSFISNLCNTHRVRESMKYVVFRYGAMIVDPVTGENLGRDTEILGDALVQSVDDKKSLAELLPKENEPESEKIREGDQVVTK